MTLNGAAAPQPLRFISLNVYEEDKSDPTVGLVKDNLAALASSQITISEDGKTAQIMFGGIYPFDTVAFTANFNSNYSIYAIDGSKYYVIDLKNTDNYRIKLKMDEPILSSYQIKLKCTSGFSIEPDFQIY